MTHSMLISYSRGMTIRDSRPEQLSHATFDEFAKAILADRATVKGETYFCGPLKPDSEGQIRRKKDNALPRAFLAFDLDGIVDDETFSKLRDRMAQYKGFGYTTASHTPEKPRARIVLAVTRAINREEGIRVSQAIQREIESEFGLDAIRFDNSVYRAEQPMYTPLHSATTFQFDGNPVDIDHVLASAKPGTKSHIETISPIGAIESTDPVLHALQERGMVIADLGGGKFGVECPCGADHTGPSSDSSTVYYAPHTGGYVYSKFHCMHDHCFERPQEDYLKALGLDPKEIRDEQAGKSAPASSFSFISARDLTSVRVQPEYLIEGYLEKNSLTLLYGASSVGKSFLSLGMAASIAAARPWFGHEVTKGPVFYIAGEGNRGIGRRIKALQVHLGEGMSADELFVSDSPAALIDVKNAKAVAEKVGTLAELHGAPALIVIDTLHRNFGGGDENSAADMSKFLNNIDVHLRKRFGCAVLIVHHTGHQENGRARGSSSIRAAVDHEYRLEEKDGIRTLVCTKNKEGELLPDLALELKQVLLDPANPATPIFSAVLVPAGEEVLKKSKPLPEAASKALKSLVQSAQENGEAPLPELLGGVETMPERVVRESIWREQAYKDGISKGSADAKKKAFARGRDSLLETGLIAQAGGYYWPVGTTGDKTGLCPSPAV